MITTASFGKFIVLDGIDGCGKGTQAKLLSDFLIKKGYSVALKKYPEYGQPIGNLINEFLYKRFNPNLSTEVLLYTADHVKDKEYIQESRENGKIILADRYFTSTIVYQYLKGFALEKILKITDLLEVPKPDLSILIKINSKTSFDRKSKEKPGNLDRHEEDKQFQTKLAETFEKMANENIFCDWAIVDGEQSPENVHQQIIEVLNKKLNI